MDIERNVAQAAQDVELFYSTGMLTAPPPNIVRGLIHPLVQVATLVTRMLRLSVLMHPKLLAMTSGTTSPSGRTARSS